MTESFFDKKDVEKKVKKIIDWYFALAVERSICAEFGIDTAFGEVRLGSSGRHLSTERVMEFKGIKNLLNVLLDAVKSAIDEGIKNDEKINDIKEFMPDDLYHDNETMRDVVRAAANARAEEDFKAVMKIINEKVKSENKA